MPRPRVLPSQRRRAADACNYCKEAKKRCSGTAPCTHCQRRGIAGQCFITLRPQRSRGPASDPDVTVYPEQEQEPRTPTTVTPLTPVAVSGRGQRAGRNAAAASPTTASRRGAVNRAAAPDESFCPISPSDSRQDVTVPGTPGGNARHRASDASSVSANPHSRMLLNLRGERVYIGGAASLSFLQIVRGMVADQIGPSQFSHNDKSDTMLEKESPNSSRHAPILGVVELEPEQKLTFLEAYHAVTEGFIDVFAPSEVDNIIMGMNQPPSNPQRLAAIDLVIAIGAQAKSASTARDIGQSYFRQAQTRAFSGLLEDPDIDMVRSFLLMAFYLLGECRRNSAFMYLGIATRAAVALGLHSRESYADMTDQNDQLRLRVWISLRIVDMLANSILGRPAATAGLHSDVDGILQEPSNTAQDEDMMRLIASHQIVCIINGIVDTLYERKEISTTGVEQLLGEIEAWAKSLPECLRSASLAADPTGSHKQKGAIGSIHVSCLYYFAVTLVTRPILISTLTAQPASAGLVQAHLASACLDAAVFLVQTCVEARKADLLYGNMCIMKALVFAAGLVLGFEIFAKRSIDYGIESAFHGARDVLNFLATQSPQAAHYYEILTFLSNAVSKQREKAASKGRNRYVSKIFTLNQPNDGSSQGESHDAPQFPSVSGEAPIPLLGDGVNWFSGNQTPVEFGEEPFLGWDSLDISQWDSFPFGP